jgi:hypothetical protein
MSRSKSPEPELRSAFLTLAVPEDPDLGMMLMLLRRLASRDLHEPDVVRLAHQAFGRNFERPLTLIRAYLIETATACTVAIKIAPHGKDKMTADEGQMIAIVALAAEDPAAAEAQLRLLCKSNDVINPLIIAQVLAKALIELGCSLSQYRPT